MDISQFAENCTLRADRLEERLKHIIHANLDAIEGKRVLDIAANNGRWTYAALAAGASHATSIEGRAVRADMARDLLDANGMLDRADLNVGDMFDFLYDSHARGDRFDTILCLGVYYHVLDHYHFLKLMARLQPGTIIIDSGFVRSFRSQVHVQYEVPQRHENALPVYDGQSAEPVGIVSLGLMLQMAWNLGYSCRPMLIDPAGIKNRPSMQDFLMGRRFVVRLDPMEGHYDSGWKEPWREALVTLNERFALLMDPETHDDAVDDRARDPRAQSVFRVFDAQ